MQLQPAEGGLFCHLYRWPNQLPNFNWYSTEFASNTCVGPNKNPGSGTRTGGSGTRKKSAGAGPTHKSVRTRKFSTFLL